LRVWAPWRKHKHRPELKAAKPLKPWWRKVWHFSEKINEAAAHFNQMTQGLSAGLVQPMTAKVDRLEHLFEDRVARALQSLGLPTAQEVADLQKRVAALEAALTQRATTSAPKAPVRKRPVAQSNKATK
jgi:hypothetical protein